MVCILLLQEIEPVTASQSLWLPHHRLSPRNSFFEYTQSHISVSCSPVQRKYSVSQNPTNIDHIDIVRPAHSIVGCGFAGIIAEVDTEAKGNCEVRDWIAAIAHSSPFQTRALLLNISKSNLIYFGSHPMI
jgi:hypothetical protein